MIQKLTVKNLNVSCGDKHIVKGVSFVIGVGETHVLMGPNGSGKSTLLAGIAGLPHARITRGSIHIGRNDLTKSSPQTRAHKGLFLGFQNPPEIPGVSIASMLRHAQAGGKSEQSKSDLASFAHRLKSTADKLGLDHGFASRSLNQGFSGGERKKSEIFQGLILQPRFAFLDEIDSGLDVDALGLCLKALRDLQDVFGTSYLFVTHNPSILSYINPTRVHVMISGRIARSGGNELMKAIEKRGFEQFINSSAA